MTDVIELRIYSRPDCHLCDVMKEAVETVARDIPISLVTVDISLDAKLEKEYGMDIPLLFHGDECLARHRVDAAALAARLRDISGR